jgi:hypothetical protein
MNNNIFQMLADIKSNPIKFAMQKGFNMPSNIGNNPNDIIQYLMNSGQVSQERYNQAYNMAQQLNKR